MIKDLEICVKSLVSFEEMKKNMIDLGFHIQEDFVLNDIYMVPKGVDISLKNHILKVKDHGIGIPEEKRELIFDRFYKIEESREINDKSFGLGLAIAKRLLDLYHDYIEVNSVENEYSEFVIYF